MGRRDGENSNVRDQAAATSGGESGTPAPEIRDRTEPASARDRRFVRDVVRGELRKGNIRLALAILVWPPGWSHTRLEDE